MSYGIGAPIDQRVDAYMGNPEALQKKYAETKDIYDLIALNQITEKQESAANAMRLAAAKKGTVYAQKESQALNNAKKEVMDEQAGVMQNKMQQQQAAQQKLMLAAGAPLTPAQPTPQQPPSSGLAGLAAPNIQGMAGGGIVAFSGTTGSAVEGDAGEAEARQYAEQQRQRQVAPQPTQQTQQAAPQNNLQAGLARLLATNPDAIYEQRRIDAARDTNFTPEERAAKERQIQERSAADREAAFINGLLGMSGRTTNAGAIAAGGAAAQNTRNQALAARHNAEGELINIGPASRAAGLKAGETAYGHAMPGLASGVKAGVDLVQAGESAANRAESAATRAAIAATADERNRLSIAEAGFNKNKTQIFKQMADLRIEPGSPESIPYYNRVNEMGKTIYDKLQIPQFFVPEPAPIVPVVAPEKPGIFQSLFGAGTKITRPGTVDFNQLSSRTSKP